MDNIYGGPEGFGLFGQKVWLRQRKSVEVNRLYYSFPVGEEFTVVGGPVVRMDDMLPVWPSAYPSDMTMDFFTYAGTPGMPTWLSALVQVCTGFTKAASAFPPATCLPTAISAISQEGRHGWRWYGHQLRRLQCHHSDCLRT